VTLTQSSQHPPAEGICSARCLTRGSRLDGDPTDARSFPILGADPTDPTSQGLSDPTLPALAGPSRIRRCNQGRGMGSRSHLNCISQADIEAFVPVKQLWRRRVEQSVNMATTLHRGGVCGYTANARNCPSRGTMAAAE
jgi:hypothetical protein